jgi:hypothetical protein
VVKDLQNDDRLNYISVPPGGNTGDVLTKVDEDDYHAEWAVPQGGGPGGGDVLSPVDPVFVGEVFVAANTAGTQLDGSGIAGSDIVPRPEFVAVSTGIPNAGAPIVLDGSGLLDPSFFPGGLGGDVKSPTLPVAVGETTAYATTDGTQLIGTGRDAVADGTALDTHIGASDPHSGHITLTPSTSARNEIVPSSADAIGLTIRQPSSTSEVALRIQGGTVPQADRLLEVISSDGLTDLMTFDRFGALDTFGGFVTVAASTFGSAFFGGSITLSGTVDGRDVAVDGSKLDTIAPGAQPGDVTSPGASVSVGETVVFGATDGTALLGSGRNAATDGAALDTHIADPSPHDDHAIGPGVSENSGIVVWANTGGQQLADSEKKLSYSPFAGSAFVPIGNDISPEGDSGTIDPEWVGVPVNQVGLGGTIGDLREEKRLLDGAGVISGLEFTDFGGGVLRVAPGEVRIRRDNSTTQPLIYATTAQTDLSIPGDRVDHYIIVTYQAGVGAVVQETTIRPTSLRNVLEIGDAIWDGAGPLVVLRYPPTIGEFHDRFSLWSQRGVGLLIDNQREFPLLGQTGIRGLSLTSTGVFQGLNYAEIESQNTTTGDNFTRLIYTATGWITESLETQWDNTRYQLPAGGTATLQTNRYSQRYWYLVPSDTGGDEIYELLGEANEVQQSNVPAELPTNMPQNLANRAIFLGWAIVQQNQNVWADFTSGDQSTIGGGSGTSPTDHNSLTNREVISAHEIYRLDSTDSRSNDAIFDDHKSGATDDHTTLLTTQPTATGRNEIISQNGSTQPLTVRGSASQSTDIFSAETSSGADALRVTEDGTTAIDGEEWHRNLHVHGTHYTTIFKQNSILHIESPYDSQQLPWLAFEAMTLRDADVSVNPSFAGEFRIAVYLNPPWVTPSYVSGWQFAAADTWTSFSVSPNLSISSGDEMRVDVEMNNETASTLVRAEFRMEKSASI